MHKSWTSWTAVLVAAGGLALAAHPAHAAVSASAELSNFSYTLIDLNLADGIAPALQFVDASTSSVASLANGVENTDAVASWFGVTHAEAADSVGSVWAATSAQALSAGGLLTPGVDNNSNVVYGAAAKSAANAFTLTSWTALVLDARLTGFATTTIGTNGALGEYEEAGAAAILNLTVITDGYYETHEAAGRAWASYEQVGNGWAGQSRSFARTAQVRFANLSDQPVTGFFDFAVSLYLQSSVSAVPEPNAQALMLLGLIGVAAIARDRKRSNLLFGWRSH
jgi:hypothetical protein